MDTFSMIMGLLAGLVLFLYGVNLLSESLKKVAGGKMKKLLERFTTNRFAGVFTGTVATTILDSSSVTIIMVIALVNAGLLSFSRSLGVIMGSNIGTTISSQVIALDINKYAPLALVIGFGLHMLAKSKKWRHTGQVIFGIGLIFFGLEVMGKSVEPLQGHQAFINWMTRLEAPVLGALVGAVFTVVVQSSSATLGIVITLATQGLISLPAGIAIMLGAEIGTCADTLMATIGRSREAVRVGVFHLLFNIITVSIGVAFAHPFTSLVTYISAGAGLSRQIANAHVLFNVTGVALFIGFVAPISKILQRFIPDKEERLPADTTVESGIVS
jgi:phosphate:Na+ symporter